TYTPAAGTVLSAGQNQTLHVTFTPTDTGNLNSASQDVSINVNKANATINVTPYSVTYDGNAHTATGSATGVKGEALAGLDLSGTTHTVAGDYPADPWTFTDVTGNYNNASGTVHDHIDKANATTVLTSDTVPYDDRHSAATGTATGVKGEALTGLDLSGTTHTAAGDYPADPWTFTDVTGNYNNASGTVHDHIDKASSTTVLTFETGPYVYRSSAFTATAQVTGVGGLNQSVTAVRSEERRVGKG